MITRKQKEEIVQDLSERLKQSSVVFVDFHGLPNKAIVYIRRELRKAGMDYKVVKKSLLRKAFEALGFKESSLPEGELAVSLIYKDFLGAIKLLGRLAKDFPNFKLSGGLLENQFISAEYLAMLVRLPSREELISQLIVSIESPISGLISTLRGNIQQFLFVLSSRSHS